MFYDRIISPKVKELIYKKLIRPVLLYGSKCWSALFQPTYVTKMKMLKVKCAVTHVDHIRKLFIEGSIEILDVANKFHKRHLSYILRRYIGRHVNSMS